MKKKNYQLYICECNEGNMGCCRAFGPALWLVKRKNKKIQVCTRCDLFTDKKIKIIADKKTPMTVFWDYDPLGYVANFGL